MCPIDFRPFKGEPLVDEALTMLLAGQVAKLQEQVQQREQMFVPRRLAEPPSRKKEDFLKQKVDAETWQKWKQVLDMLEVHGEVDKQHLLTTRLICPDVLDY
ncbi:unnamed protein product, partial [Effrenium voratum]